MPPLGGGHVIGGDAGRVEGRHQGGDARAQPQFLHGDPGRRAVDDGIGEAVGTQLFRSGLHDHGGTQCLHEGGEVGAALAVVAGLKQVDVANGAGNAPLEAVVRHPVGLGVHQVRGQERAVPVGADLRAPPHEVRVRGSLLLVILFGVEGDDLDIHVTQLHVRVIAVGVLDELRSVGIVRPLRGVDHVVVDPLVIPQPVRVRDPLVGVFGAEDHLGVELFDDVVGVVDVVGVSVRAQVERQV